MSESIQGKARQQQRVRTNEAKIDKFPSPGTAPPPSWSSTEDIGPEVLRTLLVKPSFTDTKYFTQPCFFDVRSHVQNLIESTPKDKTAEIDSEIDHILAVSEFDGNHHRAKSHSEVLSALILVLLEKDITQDAKSTRQRAFFSQVRKLNLSQSPFRTTVVSTALETAASVVKQDLSEVIDQFLVTCTNLLSPVDAISIASSVLQTYHSGLEGDQARKSFIQTVERCLDKIALQREKGIGNLISAELAEHFLYVISTHEPFRKDPELELSARDLSLKLQKNIQAPKHKMASPSTFHTDNSNNSSLVQILSDLGPACTSNINTLRDALYEITQSGADNNAVINEATLARLIYFFAEKASSSSKDDDNLSMTLIGSLLPTSHSSNNDDGSGENGWKLDVIAKVLSEDYSPSRYDWVSVAKNFDFQDFNLQSVKQLKALLALYRAGAKSELPLSIILSKWKNQPSQLSLLEQLLAAPPDIFTFQVNKEEEADAATVGNRSSNKGWACTDLLQRLLSLSDIQRLVDRVRELFIKGLNNYPEILLCSIVRLQVNMANIEGGSSSAGKQLKGELMRELIDLFFKPNPRYRVEQSSAALLRLWEISPNIVVTACIDTWANTPVEPPTKRLETAVHIVGIVRLLPESASAILNNSKDHELSIAVAFIMSDNEMIQLGPWLNDRVAGGGGTPFVINLISYIGKTYISASPRNNGGNDRNNTPLVSLENIAISLQFLQSTDRAILSQPIPSPGRDSYASSGTILDSVKGVTEVCLSKHPNLKRVVSLPGSQGKSTSGTPPPNSSSDDIEEMANSYFQKIYTSEQNIDEVVEMLKRFKNSGNTRENEIFACMIHNLFDETRFFSKYPERELRITGILFGKLIQNQLVGSITLGIALRYVLEALRKPPGPRDNNTSAQGKMFRFGMFALEQFKGRLHEWPQYCSHIVQIDHLKERYASLVAEIDGAMEPKGQTSTDSGTVETSNSTTVPQNRRPDQSQQNMNTPTNNVTLNMAQLSIQGGNISLPAPALTLPVQQPPTRTVAVFGVGLGRAVKGQVETDETQHESPPDSVLDRVQFLVNNVSHSNVEQKAQELKDILSPTYFGWLGNYMVVKRISTQPNFHSLYLAFFDQLGDYGKGLVEAILSSVYVNVGSLLRSPKITTSTSERSLLKNLGSWLGQITLARNRPILQLMLDCKELLFQGYETGMLIAVTPFVAKILEGAKNSIVFRPPNPWLMGLLSVFRALYGVDDLKMNIKFEVEVLCKNLGVKLEDIPLRTDDLAKRIPPTKERNPDFNVKSSMMGHPGGVPSTSVTAGPGISSSVSMSTPGAPSLSSPNGKQAGQALAANSGMGVSSIAGSDVKRQFSNPSLSGGNNASGSQASGSFQDQQQTVIPNLAAYVTINPNLGQLFENPSWTPVLNISNAVLKRAVPIAVDRAIREIIQPVVERSVTIACSTTKEIVTKDYAMESDENKMLKAAQLMVANLSGSLALVTCREPLRGSMTTHLRQLLIGSAGNSGNSTPALSEQEKNAIEECVSNCASDNLELGCMLIEKAATEKAVRDMDETLAPALSARKKHREQTGQPFYDMSIFGGDGHRYPAALPEPLRPKPGGLRNEQLLVYEAFQRMPRQPVVPGSQPATNVGPSGGVIGSPAGSVAGSVRSGSNNSTSSPSRIPGVGNDSINSSNFKLSQPGDVHPSANRPKVGLDALSTIAGKLDSAVTSLLSSAGARSSDITLSMLPPDSEIKQLLLVVQHVADSVTSSGTDGGRRPLNNNETDAVLGFAQNVFKRLYELSLAEPLRLEALVALLAGLNEFCPQLGQNLGTWATYAPTEKEGQRKLHRTVLLLLVRSRLIPITELDTFLAKSMDGGNNSMWIEFSLLFVRTAVLERITSASDTPKVMDILSMIGKASNKIGQQIIKTYRNPVLRLLEEIHSNDMQQKSQSTGGNNVARPSPSGPSDQSSGNRHQLTHQQSSSIGPVSLNNLADATRKAAEVFEATSRNDPPGVRQHIRMLLDSWIRVNNEAPGSEKALAQYLQLLQQNGIGKIEEQTERFFRISTELVIDSTLKTATSAATDASNEQGAMKGKVLNYNVVDAYAKLLALLVRYMNGGGSPEQVAAQRISLLNKILGVTVRTLMASYEHSKQKDGISRWDQRPWFRLLLNLVHDLNAPSPALDSISLGILSVFGSAFHVVQPLVVPGFAFAWLELISHRMFLSNLLLLKGQKGWGIAHQLLIDLFLFLEPHLRRTELTAAVKRLYKGTLRVLLVLLHDFPSFLAGYHLSFCNVIPENCIQLRHLILSAFPRGMVLPDPFTPNLKIDLLSEISQSPHILSNVTGPLSTIRADLDGYLKSRQPANFLSELLPLLYKEGTKDVDSARVNSLVLYVGMQAISRLNKSQIAHTPEMEVLQKLMDFDDRGRYISLNAIANQLRYPSSHTHYFSCVMLFLFSEAKDDGVKEQVTRVLLERLIVHRPHPWGLLITFIELIKNQRYQFWSHQFTRCATEIEKVFESVARSCMNPEGQRAVAVGDDSQ